MAQGSASAAVTMSGGSIEPERFTLTKALMLDVYDAVAQVMESQGNRIGRSLTLRRERQHAIRTGEGESVERRRALRCGLVPRSVKCV